VQLGILALARGRSEEAQALLDDGLELSLATHSTRNLTLCLTAFAQLAFVQGDGERAALLEGAAEGLRQRVGLRVWPLQQQGKPRRWLRSGRRWARTGSTRISPLASGSTANRP
jgi:ATP/maltotriose-dependent transcriptional regulator MalT